MLILEATRDHLRDYEFSKHTGFESIQLFPSFRSDRETMFTNETRVAFGGTAFYSDLKTSPNQSMDPYLCFLGPTNETDYVNTLREFGWHNLERALLLTASGERVVYMNGTMQMEPMTSEDDDEEQSLNDMMEGASRMIYTVAIGVPLAVASIVAFLCVGYLFKSNFEFRKAFNSGDSVVWRSTSSKSARLRRLDFRSDESTVPSKSGDSSIAAAVGSGQAQETTVVHPALLRAAQRSARVDTV